MNGGIDLTDGKNPKFDIGVTGNQVLLTRSDGIIVRANFNLAIRGPLSSGEWSAELSASPIADSLKISTFCRLICSPSPAAAASCKSNA